MYSIFMGGEYILVIYSLHKCIIVDREPHTIVVVDIEDHSLYRLIEIGDYWEHAMPSKSFDVNTL